MELPRRPASFCGRQRAFGHEQRSCISRHERLRSLQQRRLIVPAWERNDELTKRRETAPTVVIDTHGRLLLQRRDNIPNILYPGMIGLFGGHREGDESFLECAVRELSEELSYQIPPSRFEYLGCRESADSRVQDSFVRAEFFLVKDVPFDQLTITEGTLVVHELSQLATIRDQLTPSAKFGLQLFAKRTAN